MSASIRIRYFKVGGCRHPECMAIAGGRWRVVEFPFIAAVIEHPTEGLWLFDTGYSRAFLDATQSFPYSLYTRTTPLQFESHQSLFDQMQTAGLNPSQVRGIVLSHLHADHMAGVMDFPNSLIYASREAFDEVKRMGAFTALRHAYLKPLFTGIASNRWRWFEDLKPTNLPPTLNPFQTGFDLLGDGHLVVTPLPGHARGQYGLYIANVLAAHHSDSQQSHFLVADGCWTLSSCKRGAGTAWLTGLLHDNQQQYRQTWQALREVANRESNALRIVPSHCLETVAQLRRDGLLKNDALGESKLRGVIDGAR